GDVLHRAHLRATPGGRYGGRRPMTRQVRCECGYTARGRSDDEVIALVLARVAAEPPDLAGSETADDVRHWIELVPDRPEAQPNAGKPRSRDDADVTLHDPRCWCG